MTPGAGAGPALDPVAALRGRLAAARPGEGIALPERFDFATDVIDRIAREDDRVATVEVRRDGATVIEHRFSDVAARSVRAARALVGLGLRRGDRAVVVLPRVPAWHDVILGCIRAGVVSMPGTNLLTARDIAYRVNRAGARCAIVGAEHADVLDAIRAECPTLEHLVLVAPPGESAVERPGWHSLERLVAEAGEGDGPGSPGGGRADFGRARTDDVMMAYFTSGTTSAPKLVPRSHGYALAHVVTGEHWLGIAPGDVHWTLTDTGWAKAAWGMLFAPWLMRASVVLHDSAGFDADETLALIGRLGVTSFCAPPTIFRLFAQMDLGAYDLASIRRTTGAGEPLNPEAIRAWKAATGTTIHDGYGQTETVAIVANRPGDEVRPGSMGKPLPGFDVRTVDEAGNEVGVGAIGDVALRVTDPAPLGLFDGYWLSETERDRGSFRRGWYYTGDTATRDADGYLWFVGRSDDVISSAGYRISPFEVESALIEHPAVAESAVVGVPDELRGHVVKAYLVLAAGHEPSDALTEEIQGFVKRVTAPYKYPRLIEYREALPKTVSGKIRRVELRGETMNERGDGE